MHAPSIHPSTANDASASSTVSTSVPGTIIASLGAAEPPITALIPGTVLGIASREPTDTVCAIGREARAAVLADLRQSLLVQTAVTAIYESSLHFKATAAFIDATPPTTMCAHGLNA